jgi:CHRD domain
MRHVPDRDKEDIVFRTRLMPGAVLLIFSAACSQGSPSSTAGSASAATAVRPSEIVLPLNFSTHMHGHLETPARPTDAQGQLILKVSDDRQSIEYKLVASNISNVTASHIHQGPVGLAGPPVVFLYGPAPAGGGRHNGVLATGTITAANLIGPLANQPLSALLSLIQNGNAYANVHTNDGIAPTDTGPGDFPLGEIRGQVIK